MWWPCSDFLYSSSSSTSYRPVSTVTGTRQPPQPLQPETVDSDVIQSTMWLWRCHWQPPTEWHIVNFKIIKRIHKQFLIHFGPGNEAESAHAKRADSAHFMIPYMKKQPRCGTIWFGNYALILGLPQTHLDLFITPPITEAQQATSNHTATASPHKDVL